MPLNPPQAYRKTFYTHRRGTRALQPVATDVLPGTLYYVTDEEKLERSTGAAWEAIGIRTRVDDIQTTFTEAFTISNQQAATAGVTRQFSPGLILSGAAWDTDGAGASKTVRGTLYLRPVSGSVPASVIAIAFADDGAASFTDDIYIGRQIAGGAPDLRFRSGNIFFLNNARGIYFVANPLTDTAPGSHYIQANTNGKISLVPGTGTDGSVEIEHNAFAISAGVIPALAIRGFDQSTSTPIITIRHRAVPGGTAAAGFGSRQLYQASSNTTSNQDAGAFDCVWSDATHATRTAKFNFYLVNSAAALALKFEMLADGKFYTANGQMIGSRVNYTNGAAANVGTLNNAPAAGDPTKWIPVDDNGTTRYIPAW